MSQFIASMSFFAIILASLFIVFSLIFILNLVNSAISYFKERNYYILEEFEEVIYPQLPEFADVLIEMQNIYDQRDSLSQREIVIFFLSNIQQFNGKNIVLKRLANSPVSGNHRYQFSFTLHGHKNFTGLGVSAKMAVLMVMMQVLDHYKNTIVSTKKDKENEQKTIKQATKQFV